MKIKIKIDVKAGVIHTVAQGKIGFRDLQAQRELILSHPDYSPEFDHIFDGRSACLRFTGKESYALAVWSAEKRPYRRSALVLGKYCFPFGRMYQGWFGDAYPLDVFEEMAPARKWLGLPPEEDLEEIYDALGNTSETARRVYGTQKRGKAAPAKIQMHRKV